MGKIKCLIGLNRSKTFKPFITRLMKYPFFYKVWELDMHFRLAVYCNFNVKILVSKSSSMNHQALFNGKFAMLQF